MDVEYKQKRCGVQPEQSICERIYLSCFSVIFWKARTIISVSLENISVICAYTTASSISLYCHDQTNNIAPRPRHRSACRASPPYPSSEVLWRMCQTRYHGLRDAADHGWNASFSWRGSRMAKCATPKTTEGKVAKLRALASLTAEAALTAAPDRQMTVFDAAEQLVRVADGLERRGRKEFTEPPIAELPSNATTEEVETRGAGRPPVAARKCIFPAGRPWRRPCRTHSSGLPCFPRGGTSRLRTRKCSPVTRPSW
jgi:hypothetical protein